MPNILVEKLIYEEEFKYCSFPHIVKSSEAVHLFFRRASEFSYNAALNNVATHHDPDSEILEVISTDGCQSWTNPTLAYKSDYGVNDPAATVLSDGSLLLRFVALDIKHSSQFVHNGKKIFSHRAEHGLVTQVVGNLYLCRPNLNSSWEQLGLDDDISIGSSCSRDPVIQLEDHSLLAPVYIGAPQRSDESYVIRSFDGGKSWGQPICIASDPSGSQSQLHGINYNETSLLYNGNGSVYALIRGDQAFYTNTNDFMPVGGCGNLYICKSLDGGLCWSKPANTGLFGQPGSLMRTSQGLLMATYGCRKSPFSVKIALSADEGLTWFLDMPVTSEITSWDCGYPFTLELDKDHFITVFYKANAAGLRGIYSVEWKL